MAEQLPHSKRRPDQEGRDHDKEEEDEDEQDDNDFQASGSDSGSDGEGEGAQSRPKRTAEQDHVDAEELDFIKRDAEATGIPLGKRRRTHQPNAESVAPPSVTSNAEATKADELWQQIKRADELESSSTKATSQSEEMVKVVETYKFAGQVSTTEKLLPASHPDAIAYLKKQSEEKPQASPSARPGPRKKKQSSLAALSAAASAKPTKINTLEKSKMDWDSFKGRAISQQEKEEIEAQTKGGGSGLGSMKGYLERRDFLDRVEKRLETQGPK